MRRRERRFGRAGTWLRERRAPLALFCALWFTFGYFEHEAPGDNVNTRLDLTYAIVERGTFAIDAYHNDPLTRTGDKAVYGGHFYCDKSPGLSFLAVPSYWILWQLRTVIPNLRAMYENRRAEWVFWTRYLLRTVTVGLSAAVLGVVLWATARLLGASSRFGAVTSIAILCGTVLCGYATLFYGYLPSACCCMAAYYLLLRGRLEARARGPGRAGMTADTFLFWVGLLVGTAWLFEYTAGLAGIGLAGYAAWSVRRRPSVMYKFVLGGLVPVAVFYLYTHHVFGEWGKIPYQYEYNPFFRIEMQKGFQGIHWPRLGVLYYLTVHPFRGLFFWSPFLLLGVGAAARVRTAQSLRHKRRGRDKGERERFGPDLVLSVFVVVAYLLFNAGYFMWWGGYAAGPRLLCPAVPFFVVPLVLWWRGAGAAARVLFAFLAAIAIHNNFAIAATDPQIPPGTDWRVVFHARVSDNLPSPILRYSLPRFWRGDLARNLTTEWWRAGESGGAELGGLWSLVPLVIVWGAAVVVLVRGRDSWSAAEKT